MNYFFLDNHLTTWGIALGFTVGLYLVLMLVRGLFRRRIKTLAERGTVRGAALVQRLLTDLHGIFILAISLWLSSRWLALSESAETTLRIAVLLVVLFQIGLWSAGVVDHLIARSILLGAQEDAGRKTSLNALGVVAKIGVWALIILVGLEILPNVNVTSLITGLGIGGIAIGLAVQNILGDLFSSLTIALDKPFVIGDTINVGEFTGTVEHIGLKSTRVRAMSGEQVIFANSDLLSSRIRNFRRMEQRRVVFPLRVEVDTPTDKLERIPQLLREVIEGQKDAAFDRAHFQSITDSGLQFEVVYLITTADYATFVALQNAINLAIHRRFNEEGIVFAHLVGYAAK